MVEPPQDFDPDDDNGTAMRPDRGKTRLAGWQKVVGMIGLAVVLLIVIALVVGGGHTPPVQHGQR